MAMFYRYIIIKVGIEVDMENTDQNLEDHIDEIADYIGDKLDYRVEFSGAVEAGDSCDNAIEVQADILTTEMVGFIEECPV
jgi:hypothetical protein